MNGPGMSAVFAPMKKPTEGSSPVGFFNTPLASMAGMMPTETEMNSRQIDVAAVVAWRMAVTGLIAIVSVAAMPVARQVVAMAVARIDRCVTVTVAGLIALRVMA